MSKHVGGHIFITDPNGGVSEFQTLKCVHCHGQWVPQPGSGRIRGFCNECKGPTCGKKKCDVCIPFEQRLNILDGGNGMLRLSNLKVKEDIKKAAFLTQKFGGIL